MIPLRLAWACGLAAIALELTVSWGLPAAMPGHSLVDDYISTAGATDAPRPVLFAALGVTAALLHSVFAVGVFQRVEGRLERTGAGLFTAFFVLLAAGLNFRCDPGCELQSGEAWAHFGFGVAAFASLGVAALLVAWTAWGCGDRTLLSASLALAALDVLLLLSDLTKVYRGLTERLTLLAMAGWGILWMIRRTRHPRRTGIPTPSR